MAGQAASPARLDIAAAKQQCRDADDCPVDPAAGRCRQLPAARRRCRLRTCLPELRGGCRAGGSSRLLQQHMRGKWRVNAGQRRRSAAMHCGGDGMQALQASSLSSSLPVLTAWSQQAPCPLSSPPWCAPSLKRSSSSRTHEHALPMGVRHCYELASNRATAQGEGHPLFCDAPLAPCWQSPKFGVLGDCSLHISCSQGTLRLPKRSPLTPPALRLP